MRLRPVLDSESARRALAPLFAERLGLGEIQRVYDSCITIVEGRPHVCFSVSTAHGTLDAIVTTDDFERSDFHGVLLA